MQNLKSEQHRNSLSMSSKNNLTQCVKNLLADANTALKLNQIYAGVEKKISLSVGQKEFTRYGEPRFHHEVRAIINQLMQNGEITRVSRGKYKKI
jgi:hypothetical protein